MRKETEIKVTDRRLFTSEGELRPDVVKEEEPPPKADAPQVSPQPQASAASANEAGAAQPTSPAATQERAAASIATPAPSPARASGMQVVEQGNASELEE